MTASNTPINATLHALNIVSFQDLAAETRQRNSSHVMGSKLRTKDRTAKQVLTQAPFAQILMVNGSLLTEKSTRAFPRQKLQGGQANSKGSADVPNQPCQELRSA